ncbi:MAG: hypothetical protein Q9169_004682 [Polycauliona sp. 2 TL-2023]
MKCFPISHPDDDMLSADAPVSEASPYKEKPIRQAQEQQLLVRGARSISLRWPDEMQHAVFFTDGVCNAIQTGRPEFTWHVERLGTHIAQCESPPAGLFRSVEFMTPKEYAAFSRRMRSPDGEMAKAQSFSRQPWPLFRATPCWRFAPTSLILTLQECIGSNMGKLNDSRQPRGYRDNDAASTSSAVPLQEHSYEDDVPPAYTDDPEPVDHHTHGQSSVTGRKSVGGRAPRFIEDPTDSGPYEEVQERGKILQDVQWTFRDHTDAKGSTDTYISNALSSDPALCQAFIETRAQRQILPVVRIVGTHTETRRRDKKDETTRVTDFDIAMPLDSLIEGAWARTKIVGNHQKAYRGGVWKQLDPRVKAHPEAANTTPSLQEWCHRFCASGASAKSFKISRTVTELLRYIITNKMSEAIRGTNYRGHIAVTYPVCNRATTIVSDHWINRYRHNVYIWWICVILQLWIFTWPLLWFMTKRWEVLIVEWPCRIYQQQDGSWPVAHEFRPETRWHEGQETDNPAVRIAHMTEDEWVENWRLAVQLAAESKKRGTLTEADRRVAQEVEARSRQGTAVRSAVSDTGFVAAATGLLIGVQGFVGNSRMASGWGGDLAEAWRQGMASTSPAAGISKLYKVLFGALVCYAVYYAYRQLTLGSRRRHMIRENGCKPLRNSANLNSWKDSLFGWTNLVLNLRAAKQHKLLQFTRERFIQHGHTIHFKIGFTDIIFTTEPENLKTMLATRFNDWNLPTRRKAAAEPLLGRGIFTSDGSDWQHSRELLRPNFVRNQVADLATFENHIQHLIKAIPRDGSTLDLRDFFFRLTIDSATEFLFGESTNCLVPGASATNAQAFALAFDRSQEAVGIAARGLPGFAKLFTRSKVGKDIETAHRFVDHYVKLGLEWQKRQDVEKSTSKDGDRYIFLYELVKTIQDPVRIRSELLNILLAGRDTTASLLANVWFVLAKRSDVWVKLRQEVDSLGGERPTFEQIKDMKYLKYVLNEILRLYPVVPVNTRMSITDTVLPRGGGPDGQSPLFIPAKTNVSWNQYAIHRRKDIFGEDAEDFKPERWEKLRPGWGYLPFNGGPRICIGRAAVAAYAVETAAEGTIGAAVAIAKPTMPLKATWRRLVASKPLPRSSHSLSVIKGKAYVFGGEETPREPVGNEMHILTLSPSTSNEVDYKAVPATGAGGDTEIPAPRVGHTAATINDRIYVFGGRGGKSMEALDEQGAVWEYDTSLDHWTRLVPVKGMTCPQPRSYHSSTASVHPLPMQSDQTAATPAHLDPEAHGTVFIHAGCTTSGRLNDLWGFDIAARTWSPFPDAPGSARGGSSLTMVGNRLYRFGGFDGKAQIGGQIDFLDTMTTTIDDQGGKGEMAVTSTTGRWETVAPTASPMPGNRSVTGLQPVTTGQGRNYLVLFLGERDASSSGHAGAGRFWDDVWSFQLRPDGMTAASFKDAARQMVGANTAEHTWAPVDIPESSMTEAQSSTMTSASPNRVVRPPLTKSATDGSVPPSMLSARRRAPTPCLSFNSLNSLNPFQAPPSNVSSPGSLYLSPPISTPSFMSPPPRAESEDYLNSHAGKKKQSGRLGTMPKGSPLALRGPELHQSAPPDSTERSPLFNTVNEDKVHTISDSQSIKPTFSDAPDQTHQQRWLSSSFASSIDTRKPLGAPERPPSESPAFLSLKRMSESGGVTIGNASTQPVEDPQSSSSVLGSLLKKGHMDLWDSKQSDDEQTAKSLWLGLRRRSTAPRDRDKRPSRKNETSAAVLGLEIPATITLRKATGLFHIGPDPVRSGPASADPNSEGSTTSSTACTLVDFGARTLGNEDHDHEQERSTHTAIGSGISGSNLSPTSLMTSDGRRQSEAETAVTVSNSFPSPAIIANSNSGPSSVGEAQSRFSVVHIKSRKTFHQIIWREDDTSSSSETSSKSSSMTRPASIRLPESSENSPERDSPTSSKPLTRHNSSPTHSKPGALMPVEPYTIAKLTTIQPVETTPKSQTLQWSWAVAEDAPYDPLDSSEAARSITCNTRNPDEAEDDAPFGTMAVIPRLSIPDDEASPTPGLSLGISRRGSFAVDPTSLASITQEREAGNRRSINKTDMAPDLNAVPRSPRAGRPAPGSVSSRSSISMAPPPNPSLPSSANYLPREPSSVSAPNSNPMAADNAGVGRGPGPIRHPQPLTAADLHMQLEKEQEAVVNRLTRELSALRQQTASVASTTSSTSTGIADSTDVNANHLMSGPSHPTPSRRHRSSSSLSTRSINTTATTASGYTGLSGSTVGTTAGVAGSTVSGIAPARDSHHPTHAHSMSRQNSTTSSRRSQASSPSLSSSLLQGDHFPNLVPLRHPSSAQAHQQTLSPAASVRSSHVPSSAATARYEETAHHRSEMEHVKKENEMLRRRIRELERSLGSRRASSISHMPSDSESTSARRPATASGNQSESLDFDDDAVHIGVGESAGSVGLGGGQ